MDMNKKSGEIQPHFELPPSPMGNEALKEQAKELRPDSETTTGKQQATTLSSSPAPPQQPIIVPIPVKLGDADDTSASGTLTTDLSAQDVDLIEKQWVERAKAIVARTQNDPYIQKKEINKAGADYIKKRFNKTIPTDDAVRK